MTFMKSVLPFGLVGGAVKNLLFGKGGAKVEPSAPLAATRNDALERAAAADNLARRTGARRLRRTPTGGAEAATSAPSSLLGRSG